MDLPLPGLRQTVQVLVDADHVPHIFAQNNYDLFYAQGYVHAYYRLWQMEFQTHAAAGRLSELLGPRALSYDLHQRRFGMVYAAEKALEVMWADSICRQALEAYTAGVNAFIDRLPRKSFPIEYKLLDYQPEPWTPLKCALLLKMMTYDLTTLSDDLFVTNARMVYGRALVDSLFSGRPVFFDPIIPANTTWPFRPAPVPQVPEVDADTTAGFSPVAYPPDRNNGSNNWVIGRSRTASGGVMLCGDPHLRLSLPSLWFAMQLVSPEYCVAGATLPGTPTVIIGFNRWLAWSETNVDADVLDWYRIDFSDSTQTFYWYGDRLLPIQRRAEVIHVRGRPTVVDTVLYTHYGPIVALSDKPMLRSVPTGYALKWLGHEGGLELKTFLLLNMARNYDEFVHALTYFQCPAQNFAYADIAGNIALWVNGKFPLKWPGQGKYLLDGRNPAHQWQGWIPHDHNPHVSNPPQDYLCSANQSPADSSYPYYLNWRFELGSRAHRLNKRLSVMHQATVDTMRLLQVDNCNALADLALPYMLQAFAEVTDTLYLSVLEPLRTWDRRADPYSIGQTIFHTWWHFLEKELWQAAFGSSELRFPTIETTLHTLLKNQKEWSRTPAGSLDEQQKNPLLRAWKKTVDSLRKTYGSDWSQWQWGRVRKTHVGHLLQIESFSRRLPAGGDAGIVNATKTNHGPSWRFVVELTDSVRAYWIYPGGQSGNPGSPAYDNLIEPWLRGELFRFAFWEKVEEAKESVTWYLKPH